MTEYIKQYIMHILNVDTRPDVASARPTPESKKVVSQHTGAREVAKELDRLDPRDFEVSFQSEFVRVRGNVAYYATLDRYTGIDLNNALKEVIPVLDHFRGPGSFGVLREFPYLHDVQLRTIVERDYVELAVRLFPAGAWKSTVVMAGSILEALLLDVLTNPKRTSQAQASSQAPKGSISKGEWRLEKLIDVASDIGVVRAARKNSIDQSLRNYRNFVHPKKEVRSAHPCSEAEALMAKGALDGVCNHFEKTL